MKPRPSYATRCAVMCSDSRGYPRQGDQWIHLWGVTQWVCSSCAEHYSRLAGIPSRAQVRADTRRREARMQLSLDLAPETHFTTSGQAS